MTELCLDKYAGREEAKVARRLVRVALESGYAVSVNDGEEWTVKASRNRDEILAALATTGIDTLRMRDAEGNKLGDLMLVYQDGPGDELIADYSDNDAMNELYNKANV